VAGSEQCVRRGAPARELVGKDGGQRVRRRAVEKHGPPVEDPGKPDGVPGDRGDDDAVHLSREQVLDEVALHLRCVL
jgi:hypothetical protein